MNSGGYFAWKRKPGQRVFLEGGIEIKIGESTKGEVQLLIKAPGLKVMRPSKEQDAFDRIIWMQRKGAESCR